MVMIIRAPVVAGSFYDIDKDRLQKQISAAFKHKLGPKPCERQKFVAAIVPHAGYDYSGAVTAWIYSRIEKANYIILGPNHQGIGVRFAIMQRGLWKTPLGEVAIKEDMAKKLMDECKILEQDVMAHQYEHSIEIQLPFLQHEFGSDFGIVPICIRNEFADETLLESCKLVGKSIANVIKKDKEKWIIIASSDFSHYVPQEVASKNDNYVIKSILKLDEKDFFSRINARNATICGFGPIAVAMVAAKSLGVKKAELLKYATSGDTTQDYSSVVGYASIVMR